MTTLTPSDRRLRSAEFNLEVGTATPNLRLMLHELEQAQSDAEKYRQRNSNAFDAWHSRWPNQRMDGRKHADEGGPDPFPWEGASDVRVRTVDTTIREHVLVDKIALRRARIQAQTIRPLAEGQARQSQQGTRLLQWLVGKHMHAERRREEALALAWKWAYGLSVIEVGWETSRRLEYHKISIPLLSDVMQTRDGVDSQMLQLMEMIFDPSQEEALAQMVQQLSPIVTTALAHKIVRDLREVGESEVPVPYVYKSKPKWTALRPGVDLIFPGDCANLQEARFNDRFELVTETDLKDRIETEAYDRQFVAEALKHKGKGIDEIWLSRSLAERAVYGEGQPYERTLAGDDQFRDLVLLHHFSYRAIDRGTPCLYKTVFNPHCMGQDRKNPICAKHSLSEYWHGMYPYVEMCRRADERALLSSAGIAEEAYTDEQEIKRQRDGLADRTDLSLKPFMVVPHNRVSAIKGNPLPGAVLGAMNPERDIKWGPLPPKDETPILVLEMVQRGLDRRYPLFPNKDSNVDPALAQAYREMVVGDTLADFTVVLDHTFKLAQQFEPDEEVQAVVGTLQRPFQVTREEIQEAHEISATYDARMLDQEYAKQKLELIGLAMPLNQLGTAKMDVFFRKAMEIADIDLADLGIEDTETATQKEVEDEEGAFAKIMAGVEPRKPMFGNHQLRLQTLMRLEQQNPRMQERLAQNPDSQELLKNRREFFENQMQQYQQNPGIGRAVSTQTFNTKLAPMLTMGAGGS